MIGVIADDLTGAAEIGAVALRYGLRAEIIHAAPVKSGADLICFNTDSRSCRPAVAGRRAAAAAKALAAAGADWIYKKTDSVLRGPVAAELAAILKQLKLELALLLPANPGLGRTIRGGRYYLHGRPIHKTEFARDPEHPRRSPEIEKLLRAGRSYPLRIARPGIPLPSSGIAVGDVATPDDLRQWAARRATTLLPAGGGEFFAALLAGEGRTPRSRRKEIAAPSRSRELFVCGSLSESARRFVNGNRRRGVPVYSLPETPARGAEFRSAALRDRLEKIVAAFKSHRRVILNVGLPPIRDRRAARGLAGRLAQLAAAVLKRAAVDHVYAEGGATATALIERMGWKRLQVVREAAHGVATLAVGREKLLLTIKPGSYAWPLKIRIPGAGS